LIGHEVPKERLCIALTTALESVVPVLTETPTLMNPITAVSSAHRPSTDATDALMMDQSLIALFRQLVKDPAADLCAILSTRRGGVQYTATRQDGLFEISLTPDSPRQQITVDLRHGDVHYQFVRRFTHNKPYGGVYQGVKLYDEVGMVPLSDPQVHSLMQQWIAKLTTEEPAFLHTVRLIAPVQ
jgi:hypothetical protein